MAKKKKGMKNAQRKSRRLPSSSYSVRKSKTRPVKRAKKISRKKRKLSSKTNRKNVGVSVKVKVQSKLLDKKVIIKRKETRYKKSARVVLKKSTKKDVLKRVMPTLEKHNKKIGKTLNDFKYVKYQYKYKLGNKTRTGYFSGAIAEVKNDKDLKKYSETVLDEFINRLSAYNARGFSDIEISGALIQGYENLNERNENERRHVSSSTAPTTKRKKRNIKKIKSRARRKKQNIIRSAKSHYITEYETTTIRSRKRKK